LVRAIVHPLYYSNTKNSLKREAFLPPANEVEVSLLRLYYTNANFCKNHSAKLNINNQQYCGLSTLNLTQIETLNNDVTLNTNVQLKGTPLDENNNYRIQPPIFTIDSGLPMHAGLIYNTPLSPGTVQTNYRQFASKLAKMATYFGDPSPKVKNWKGDKLVCKN
jgi:hypothetical protein